jgi:hypothetical protein
VSSISDYIRQNAAAHSREVIDTQLRAAGHPEEAITAAWAEASAGMPATPPASPPAAPPSPTLPGVVPSGGSGPISFGTGRGATAGAGAFASTPLARVIAVVAIALVAAAIGIVTFRGDDGTSSRAVLDDEQLVDAASDVANVDESVMESALEHMGGSVEGELPAGWKEMRDGLWMDTTSGNNVNLIVSPTGGMAVEDIVDAGLAQVSTMDGVRITEQPRPERLGDREATRVDMVQQSGTTRMELTQWYVEDGDDLWVVTLTITPRGTGDVDEAREVAARVRAA